MQTLTQVLVLLVAAATVAVMPVMAAAGKRKVETSSSAEFAKPEHVLSFINGYRQAIDRKRVPAAVKAMSAQGAFRDPEQAGVYIGFIAGIIGSDAGKAETLVAQFFPMPPEEQVVLIKAIAYSGLPDWKGLLGKFVERMPARKVLIERYLFRDAPTLEKLPLDDGGAFALDAHWGYYFATGSDAAARRIISALAWSKEKNNVERLTIGSMAKWTLATNASRDKALLDLCKAEMNSQPKEVTTPLRDVIEAAETFETQKVRREALTAIEELKRKGPQSGRDFVWWGQAGQTALALGCIAAGVLGQVYVGIPCVLGGALSSAALKYLGPEQ